MVYNYLKLAIRSLRRNPLFSGINIVGLALSISICLIALMVIKEAFTYDRFHPYPSRTYRLITDIAGENGQKERWATAPIPLAEKLETDYPFVEKAVRVYTAISDEVSYGSKAFSLEGAFTDPAFFDVFGFELLYGDRNTALARPYSVVLPEKTATLMFNNENPVGRTITFKRFGLPFTITGVLKDNHQKTHLDQKLFASFATVAALEAQKKLDSSSNNWKEYGSSAVYVLLKEHTSPTTLQNALAAIAAETFKQDPPKNVRELQYDFQNIKNISPGEELINGGHTVATTTLVVFGGITFLVLLLACFNYTNLSLARSFSRAREVGIRKVVGGSRLQVFVQFITEAVVVSFIALAVAYFILSLLIKLSVVSEGILENAKPDASLLLLSVFFAAFTGLLAGSVPAWVLSNFNMVQVLKNLSSVKLFKSFGLQKFLIVFQFTVSLVFVIFLLTIYQQTQFLTSFSYGFNQQNIINVSAPEKNKDVFKVEIGRIAGVENVTASSALLGFHASGFSRLERDKGSGGIGTDSYFIDENFLPVMGLRLVAGSNFATGHSAKEQAVILNEKAVKRFGFKSADAALGKTVLADDTLMLTITGVVKDFNYLNPKHAIGNLALRYAPEHCNYFSVKVEPQRSTAVIAALKQLYKEQNREGTFSFTWYEKELKDARAKSDEFSVVAFLALLAICIACMGLLGIATYTARVRQKEVGIRKVMGAEVKTIVYLLSKDFVLLLAIASVVALPVGYLLSSTFLNEFAYRIIIGWQILGVSTLFIMLLGLLTIGSQTLKAAVASPVKHLRTE